VNDLRWQPPQSISWSGVWDADRKMPECMQILRRHDINNYFGEEATSEDCLYLNIWSPPGSKANAKLPVIVFMYGGGGVIGSSTADIYDGTNMAKKGVVFVTINYRIGILGWMAHPELTKEQGGHSGNYAYLDQLAAIKWVHNNISRFGGDSSHVVIGGQSAGASSVSALMHSPLAKGLFQGAFMSSACSIAPEGPEREASLASGEKMGLEIQKRLGATDLKHMRYVPADQIIALQSEARSALSPGSTVVRTGAVVDNYFTTESKLKMGESHQMSDVPVLANFNSGESSSPLFAAKTVAVYNEIATKMFGADAEEFLKLYPVTSDSDVVPMANKVASESGIANMSRNCGVQQAKFNTSKVYIDMFDRKHSYAPGVEILDQDTSTVGAYHSGDLVFWFEDLEAFNKIRHTRDWTDWDRKLSDEMSDALIAFARSGNPSTPSFKWPAWSATSDVFIDFGDTIKVEPFNAKGMEWLAAHRTRGAERPGVGPSPRGIVTTSITGPVN
jgi:para-nitrobenzyl esterase